MSDRETPGEGDLIEGWRVRWTSRIRRNYQRGELHEPVLILTKAGRSYVEVKGQCEIDRPVMLAHGMVSANLCDAHFARQWGDEAAALRYEMAAGRWRDIVKVRTVAAAVQRVNGRAARMMVSPAGAGARSI